MSTELGRKGESRAARYLQRRGYHILARNVRLGRGELDIIARRGDLIVFVEVKTHQSRESALQAMHADKCARLRSAAEAWLAGHPDAVRCQSRFDLIMLIPGVGLPAWMPPRIEVMEDIIR